MTQHRDNIWSSLRWLRDRAVIAIIGAMASLFSACDVPFAPESNPFAAAPRLTPDGESAELTGELAVLGDFVSGDCLAIEVAGEAVQEMLILVADDQTDGQAVSDVAFVAGGGSAGEALEYAVLREGRHFLLLKYEPAAATAARQASVTISACASRPDPPTRQRVRIAFAEGFLTDPGLWDALDGTDEERAFLASTSALVRNGIIAALQERFAQTPIEIVDSGDATASPTSEGKDVSVVHFLPDRVLAEAQDVIDVATTPPDPARPQCLARVVFGEVLPRGAGLDIGNRMRDDQANVYVGSFQGRGLDCRTAVTDSVGNIVRSLSQTAAHEIGHLVGLAHVEQMDVMNRSATVAFFRELPLGRGQLQSDQVVDGELVSAVLTGVIQDPSIYFASIFAPTFD